MTRLEELDSYLDSLGVGYGLAIGKDSKVVDLVLEGMTDQQSADIRGQIINLFPDVVQFS